MKRKNYSSLNIFLKLTLLINVIIILLGTSFIIINNNNLLPYIINKNYKILTHSFSNYVLIIGIPAIILNLILIILIYIFNKQKYFKLLEKIDFDNIESSIILAGNIKSFDEFGFMGKKLKNFLEIYLNFSKLKKLRIEFEQDKFEYLMDRLKEGAILLIWDEVTYVYRISYINNKASDLLKLEDKRSIVKGKTINFMLEQNNSEQLLEVINTIELNKHKSAEDLITDKTLKMQVNLEEMTSKALNKNEKIEPVFSDFQVKIIPFIYKWQYETVNSVARNEQEKPNIIVDSILLLFEKKGFWK